MPALTRKTGRPWGPLLAATMLLHPASLSLALEAPELLAGALLFAWAACGGKSSGEARRVGIAGTGVALVALQSPLTAAILILVPLLFALHERNPADLCRAALMAVPGFACIGLISPQNAAVPFTFESSDLSYWLAGPAMFAPCALVFRIGGPLNVFSVRWRGGFVLWLAALVAIATGTGGWSATGLLAPWMAFALGPSARAPHLQSLLGSSITAFAALALLVGAVPATPALQAHAAYVVPVERPRLLPERAPARFWSSDRLIAVSDNQSQDRAHLHTGPKDQLAEQPRPLDPVEPPVQQPPRVTLAATQGLIAAGGRSIGFETGSMVHEAESDGSPSSLKTLLSLTLGIGPQWIPDLSFRRIDGFEEATARAPAAALTVWSKYELSAGIAIKDDIYVQAWGAQVKTGPFGDDSIEAGLTATLRF